MALTNFTPGPPAPTTPPGNGAGAGGNNNGNPPTGGPLGPLGSMLGGGAGGGQIQPTAADMDRFLINYNEKFKNAQPILFRDEVIDQTMGVLLAKKKPNLIMVGPAGCGKTAIAEEVARRIATADPRVPAGLQNKVVYELPLSALVSGASLVGELEQNCQMVLAFLADPANNAIVFIDEIHMLAAGSHNTIYDNVAQIFKPALSRGKIKVIGATTTQEYQNFRRDPALNRRFSPIIVDEFTQEQTVTIVANALPSFLQHHNNKVVLSVDDIPDLVRIADEFKSAGNHRPDTALTLLDRALADTLVQRRQLVVKAQTDPVAKQILAAQPIPVTTKNIIRQTATKIMTGNAKPLVFNAAQLGTAFSVIKGQTKPIETVSDMVLRHNLNLREKKRPLVFLFTGMSGCGKTETARVLAKELTKTEPITLNMAEYAHSSDISRILGAPPGYVGYSEHSELPFDNLITNPYQIILLDEFEKCCTPVQRLFMNVFEDGEMVTSAGQHIDFSRAIIIATTNAGCTNAVRSVGFEDRTTETNNVDLSVLKRYFDLELLNRMNVVMFNAITKETYKEILVNRYDHEYNRLMAIHKAAGLQPAIPDDKIEEIIEKTFVPEFGARPALRAIEKYVEDAVLDYMTARQNMFPSAPPMQPDLPDDPDPDDDSYVEPTYDDDNFDDPTPASQASFDPTSFSSNPIDPIDPDD